MNWVCGRKGYRRLLLSWRRFCYVCQRIGKGAFGICLFWGLPVQFWPGRERGKGCRRHYTLSDGAFGMHAGGPGGRARGIFKPFAYPPFNFPELGREGGKRAIAAVSDTILYGMERRSRGLILKASKRQFESANLGSSGPVFAKVTQGPQSESFFGKLAVQGTKREGRLVTSWGDCLHKNLAMLLPVSIYCTFGCITVSFCLLHRAYFGVLCFRCPCFPVWVVFRFLYNHISCVAC